MLNIAVASDKVYQLLAHGRWFSPGTPASSTIKTGRLDIAEILLKVALNTINQSMHAECSVMKVSLDLRYISPTIYVSILIAHRYNLVEWRVIVVSLQMRNFSAIS
jgi:hypothetical protein